MREKAISNGYHLQLMNGVLFVILFASAAYQLSQWHYISLLGISPLIVGIVLGMVYGNTLRLHLPVYWLPGILFSSKVLLRVAIVLYGFRLTFQDLALVGVNGLAISAFMLTSTFIGGSWLGMKVFGLPRRLALLTAAGSSVCGAAAVLATEPVVRGESHESSIAVGTVVVFGTIAMFVYPFLFTHGYFDMSVYPASTPISLAVTKNGTAARLMEAGCVMKPAFCGPCFGAGDTPANQTLSIRHATRNFANREGSKPGSGQIAAVALMDARSIAATARNGGVLTAATDISYAPPTAEELAYRYDGSVYAKRCYEGFGRPDPEAPLRYGPNIRDWPRMPRLEEDLLVRLCAVIHDPVTTTDELIPSGETSSYRSNPLKLAEFTLSRKDPQYVSRAKAIQAEELKRRREAIKAKVAVARTQGKLNEIGAASDKAEDAMSAFQRMEEKADRMLERETAMAELNAAPVDGQVLECDLNLVS